VIFGLALLCLAVCSLVGDASAKTVADPAKAMDQAVISKKADIPEEECPGNYKFD
jgi:hypothetical protein